MRNLFTFFILILISINAVAQELYWNGKIMHQGSMKSALCPKDNNGNFSAAIDVILPNLDFEVQSDRILKTEDIINGKRIFVSIPQKSKVLKINTAGYYTLEIPFSAEDLVAQEVYRIVIKQPASKSQNEIKVYADNGDMYYQKKDYYSAFENYIIAANNHDVKSQYYLGYMYENGLGTKKDVVKAWGWYTLSADGGYDEAESALALLYLKDKDTANAEKWLTVSAEKGNDQSQYHLGKIYLTGFDYIKVDTTKAIDLFVRSAKQGNHKAQYQLGKLYEKKAIEMFSKSSELPESKIEMLKLDFVGIDKTPNLQEIEESLADPTIQNRCEAKFIRSVLNLMTDEVDSMSIAQFKEIAQTFIQDSNKAEIESATEDVEGPKEKSYWYWWMIGAIVVFMLIVIRLNRR